VIIINNTDQSYIPVIRIEIEGLKHTLCAIDPEPTRYLTLSDYDRLMDEIEKLRLV